MIFNRKPEEFYIYSFSYWIEVNQIFTYREWMIASPYICSTTWGTLKEKFLGWKGWITTKVLMSSTILHVVLIKTEIMRVDGYAVKGS